MKKHFQISIKTPYNEKAFPNIYKYMFACVNNKLATKMSDSTESIPGSWVD